MNNTKREAKRLRDRLFALGRRDSVLTLLPRFACAPRRRKSGRDQNTGREIRYRMVTGRGTERFGFSAIIASRCLCSALRARAAEKHGARNRNRSDGADRQLAESAAPRPFPGARCESLLYIFATKKHPHGVFFV